MGVTRGLSLVYSLALALLLAGCLPIPNLRADLKVASPPYRLDPRAVATEYISLPGYRAPGTPADLNRTFYLRYYAPATERPGTVTATKTDIKTDIKTDTKTDTVLVLMPGIFGGATSFDPLARQLVASRAGLEVWAVDRRANALEDRRALQESLRTRDPETAYRYYVTDAGTPAGFNAVREGDVGFMRRWGLTAHLYDLHEIVKKARAAADTVILGGHSLGASLAGFYAAYRFPGGTGDSFIDGMVLLDGTLGRTGAFGFTRGLFLGELELIPVGSGYDAGRGPPFVPVGGGPGLFAANEAEALLARFRPDDLAPDADFPATNLAHIGIRSDDDLAVSGVFGTSLGEAVGARYGGNLLAFVIDGPVSSGSRTVAGVADGFDAVTWTQAGAAREYTDMDSFLRARVAPEADFNEWYFPLRLLVDMSELPLDLSGKDDFVVHGEVTAPTLAVGAARGLVGTLDGFSAYSNLRAGALFSSYVVPGFTHLDITTARDNPVVPLFDRWLTQITQLRRSD